MSGIYDDPTPCPECHVPPGAEHASGCDVALCGLCGVQAITCHCEAATEENRVPWSGHWPGHAECHDLGFYCRWVSRKTGKVIAHPSKPGLGTWRTCGRYDEGARPDLNRLVEECVWNPDRQRFELPATAAVGGETTT